jgi:hypothetical protein
MLEYKQIGVGAVGGTCIGLLAIWIVGIIIFCCGGFPLELGFSERVAEVRDSPKFFRILRIEFTSS